MSTFFAANARLSGIDLHCPALPAAQQSHWLRLALEAISLLRRNCHLSCLLISISLPAKSAAATHLSPVLTSWADAPSWTLTSGIITTSTYSDPVFAQRWIAYGTLTDLHSAVTLPPPSAPLSFESLLRPSPDTPAPVFHHLPTPPPPSFPEHTPQLLWTLSPPSPSSPPASPSPSIPVYDPSFPLPEPSPSQLSTTFGHQFAIAYRSSPSHYSVRPSSATESLTIYSFPLSALPNHLPPSLLASLPAFLPSSLPFSTASAFAHHIFSSHVFPTLSSAPRDTSSRVCCLLSDVRSVPTPTDWTTAYHADPDTHRFLLHLQQPNPPPWPPELIAAVDPAYRPYLQANSVTLRQHHLTVRQQLFPSTQFLSLILVPKPLRSLIFDAYHAGPTSAHFGRYKTLHRIRQRFFWPKLTSDITTLCRTCAHCLASRNTIHHNSELSFSWPVSVPFAILHIDLWEPGRVSSSKLWRASATHLLAAMCDLTGFIICEETNLPTSEHLAELFLRRVLLKVGFCSLVVVDADSKFCGTFKDVCRRLQLAFHPISKHNHKALSVERFFKVLNKALTIAATDRASPPAKLFIPVAQTTAYAWNASAIDGTNISRSVAAVGREFPFPFDLSLTDPPLPVHGDLATVYHYLRQGQAHASFATDILKFLAEDRREYHRNLANADRKQRLFRVGDLVTARVTVQSRASTGQVYKLQYRQRGPYEIVDASGHGAYSVRAMGKPNAAIKTFHAQDLSLLPPRIRPTAPVDTVDFRYLNRDHPPIHHPFRSSFNIKRYNETWLSQPRDLIPPPLPDTPPTANPPKPATPPADDDDPETVTADGLPSIPFAEPSFLPAPQPDYTHASLLSAIEDSTDRLFFVQYTPPEALRARWYLVAVDLPLTLDPDTNCGNPAITGRYYVHFYARHPNDSDLSDPSARWWPEWHAYSTDPSGTIDYGDRILFFPHVVPDASRYIAWATVVDLFNPTTRLLGPFDFQDPALNPPDLTPTHRQHVPLPLWQHLFETCLSRAIQPPLLTMPPAFPTDPPPAAPTPPSARTPAPAAGSAAAPVTMPAPTAAPAAAPAPADTPPAQTVPAPTQTTAPTPATRPNKRKSAPAPTTVNPPRRRSPRLTFSPT